jgi:hypothetical protein
MNYVTRWPERLYTPSGITVRPTPEQCRAAGYELLTPEMIEAARVAAEEAARNEPYEISKLKLLKAFDALGKLDELVAFIEANPRRKLFWDAAMTLDSDDPMILEARAAIQRLVGELDDATVDAILRSARRDALG